jgi:exodeoxyribonuclease VII large subunit
VADARAATPTKAAEIGVPDINEVAGQLETAEKRLRADVRSKIMHAAQNLETILASSVFRNPFSIIGNSVQQLDETDNEINNALNKIMLDTKEKLQFFYEKIVQIEPHRLLGRKMLSLNELQNRGAAALSANIARNTSTLANVEIRLGNLIRQRLSKSELILTANENRLAGLNPRSVLTRGYSITTNKRTGGLVHSMTDVEINDVISTELSDGNFIESSVNAKHNVAKQEYDNGRKSEEK